MKQVVLSEVLLKQTLARLELGGPEWERDVVIKALRAALEHPAVGPVTWLPMSTAPRDGTLIHLLVDFEDHATEDGPGPHNTIGSNTSENEGQDVEWQFAGWNWEHDCYTQGVGKPVGWLPMTVYAASQPAQQAPAASAWDEGYRAGVNDERMSEESIGIAGFGAKVEPARNNPYRGATQPQHQAMEPVAEVYQKLTGGNSFPDTGVHILETAPLLAPGTKLYTSSQPQQPTYLKDHEIAALVNRLRDIAVTFHSADQLRERIAAEIRPLFKSKSQAEQTEAASPSPTDGMSIAQRIRHVGGRNNKAGYVEFGSIQAVEALVKQVLRDLPQPVKQESVPLLSQDDRDAVRLAAEQLVAADINGSWSNALISATEAAWRQKAGIE